MRKMMARELGSSEAGGGQLIVGCLLHWRQGTSLRGGEREERASRSGPSVGQPVIPGMTRWKDAAIGNSAGNEPQPEPEESQLSRNTGQGTVNESHSHHPNCAMFSCAPHLSSLGLLLTFGTNKLVYALSSWHCDRSMGPLPLLPLEPHPQCQRGC